MDPDCNDSDVAAGGGQQDDNPADVSLESRLWELLARLHEDCERAQRTKVDLMLLRGDKDRPETMELQKTHCPPDVQQTRAQRLSYSTKKSLSKINLAKKPSKPKSKIRDHHEKVHEFYRDAFNERPGNVSPPSTRARRDYLQKRVDDLDKLHTERPLNASRYQPDLGYKELRDGLQRRRQEEDWQLPDSSFHRELMHVGAHEERLPPAAPTPPPMPPAPYVELFVDDGIRILMATLDPSSDDYKSAEGLLQDFQADKRMSRRTPVLNWINKTPVRLFQKQLMAFYEDAYRQNDENPMYDRNAAKIIRRYLDGVLQELETLNANGPSKSGGWDLEYSFERLHEALQRRIMEVEYRIPGGNIYRDERTNAFILINNHRNNMKSGVAGSVRQHPRHFESSSPAHDMGNSPGYPISSPDWEVSGIFENPGDPDEIYAGYTKQNERDLYLMLLREYKEDFASECELTTPEQVDNRIQYLETRRRQVEAMLANLPENAGEYDDLIGTNPRDLIVRYNRLIAELEGDLV